MRKRITVAKLTSSTNMKRVRSIKCTPDMTPQRKRNVFGMQEINNGASRLM